MKLENKTNCKKAEEFLNKKIVGFDTEKLIVTMKDDYQNGTTTGFCRYPVVTNKSTGRSRYDWKNGLSRITARIGKLNEFNYVKQRPVGSKQLGNNEWEYIYDSEKLDNDEQTMVWILGHEMFHFLRKTKQVEGRNTETQANKFAFQWLREFKKI